MFKAKLIVMYCVCSMYKEEMYNNSTKRTEIRVYSFGSLGGSIG